MTASSSALRALALPSISFVLAAVGVEIGLGDMVGVVGEEDLGVGVGVLFRGVGEMVLESWAMHARARAAISDSF